MIYRSTSPIHELMREEFSCSEFLMPGFVDAHVHPFQYACVGMSLERTLMDWLSTDIRPLINHFLTDEHFAHEVHTKAVVGAEVQT